MSEEAPKNFILDFVKYCQGTEIPDMFAMWCGITGVSIALGRKVYVNMGIFDVYPNFYTILIAGSGQKKSTPIDILEGIVRELQPPPNIVGQKLTPEALIKALRVNDTAEGGKIFINERCEGWAIVDELINFLNKNVYDAGMAGLLTAFYDCKKFWEYRTLSRGVERMQNVYLGILGGTTIEFMQSAIPEIAVGAGVTSRMMLVYAPSRPEPVPIPEVTEEKRALYDSLIKSLQDISTLKGPITLHPEASEFFREEYKRFYNSPFQFDGMLRGYASRRDKHLLKIAACLAISATRRLEIRLKDIQTAKVILEGVEKYLPIVMSLITSNAKGAMIARVYELIKRGTKVENGKVTQGMGRPLLMSLVLHQVSTNDLRDILETLRDSGKIHAASDGKTIVYYAT